jgi:peptidoglycan/xylan/chitin deacetylase (PgdA/CDA1 family)/GT2 family glycosyltransferase
MAALPFVSVVVPAFNEEERLSSCLDALQRQDYAGGFEIIVVDNASTDGTPGMARAMGIQVIHEPCKGYVHAARSGYAAAKGEIIASTDADTIVPADWLTRMVSSLQADRGVVAVGGLFKMHGCAPWLAHLLSVASRHVGHPSGGNMAVRRWAYEAAGGFDPRFNLATETELSARLRRFGRVIMDPSLIVSTSGRRYQYAFWPNIWRYPLNELWVRIFHQPLFYDFSDIRGPCRPSSRPHAQSCAAPALAALGVYVHGAEITPPSLWLLGAVVVLAASILFIYLAEVPQAQIFGPALAIARVDQRVIALTFDDGPSPCTPEVLGILSRYRVPGTFFLIGRNIKRHPDMPARIVAAGSAIGNHSDSHSLLVSVGLPSLIGRELAEAASLIQDAAQVTTALFRPPRGLRTPWMIHSVRNRGYTVVTWSIQAKDWTNPRPRPEVIARRIVQQAKPGGIILLHDGHGTCADPQAQNMVAALPTIIEQLQAQGYRFVTVPELIRMQKPNGGVADQKPLASRPLTLTGG